MIPLLGQHTPGTVFDGTLTGFRAVVILNN